MFTIFVCKIMSLLSYSINLIHSPANVIRNLSVSLIIR